MPPARIAPGVRLNVGISGAGKSHLNRIEVFGAVGAGVRCGVLDIAGEWTHAPEQLASHVAGAQDEKSMRAAFDAGKRLVILRTDDAPSGAEALCAWARDAPELRGVFLPEAHNVAPNGGTVRIGKMGKVRHRMPPALLACATRWRLHNVLLWCDTQRLALLSRTITEQATTLRLFAMVGDTDLKRVQDFGGRELLALIKQAAERLGRGEPGWHVELGYTRTPPYRLVRAA